MRSRSSRAPATAAILAAALLAGGCRVDVDGAPCAVPGSTADCPDDQACGNELRCSARALACAQSRCTPGERRCDGRTAAAVECNGADPVCGRWLARDDCAARGLACGTRLDAQGACECPAAPRGTVLVADPGGTATADEFPYPNGQAWPRECRFGRLGDALAAAAALAPAAAVVGIDAEEVGTVTFGDATGEAFPLVVAPSVTVAGAAAAGPTVIRALDAPAVLSVQGAVEDLRVDAEGATTTGVRVTAPGVRLVRVEVSGAAGAALEVNVDPAAATTVEVLGGSYRASKVGIWIRGGRVRVAPDPANATTAVASENPGSTVVADNAMDGVVIGGHAGRGLPLSGIAVEAVLDHVLIEMNGGAGLVIAGLPSVSRASVSSCDFRANGASSPVAYGPSGLRSAAGALIAPAPIAGFGFRGNRLWSNAGDQLGFESGSWDINAAQCGPDTNVFACVPLPICIAGGACAVALTQTGTESVNAQYNAWPPGASRDHVTTNVINIDPPNNCGSGNGVPAVPVCP